jgi:hypothetical protein
MSGILGNFWSLRLRYSGLITLYRPMSQITNVFGTNDDQEILTSLYTIVNVSSSSPLSGLWLCAHYVDRTLVAWAWSMSQLTFTMTRTIPALGSRGLTVTLLKCFWTSRRGSPTSSLRIVTRIHLDCNTWLFRVESPDIDKFVYYIL